MINCYNCIYLDAENHFCKRRVHNVPGICPYAEEKKPRNNFDWVRSLSEREFAEWLDAVSKAWYDEGYTKETDEPLMSPYPSTANSWLEWLKKEIE